MAGTREVTVMFDSDAITTTVTSSGKAVEDWIGEVLSVHRRRLHRFVVGRLSNNYQLEVENTVDLREEVAEVMDRPDLRQAGLQAIASAVMSVDMVKPQEVRMGPYDAHRLSDQQIKYACIDAFVSFEVARRQCRCVDC